MTSHPLPYYDVMRESKDSRFLRLRLVRFAQEQVSSGGPCARPRFPPEKPFLGQKKAVTGVLAAPLGVKDALEAAGEETLHLLAELNERSSGTRGRRQAEFAAEVREATAERDTSFPLPNGFGGEVGDHQARVTAVGQADVRGSEDRERVVAVASDEFIRLRVAVGQGRLN